MRFDKRCAALWILLIGQVIFTLYYLAILAPIANQSASITHKLTAISFIDQPASVHFKSLQHARRDDAHKQLLSSSIYLSKLVTKNRQYFFKVNSSSVCFKEGANVALSIRYNRCSCLNGWHGPDCGLPEVIWRAFIAMRHKYVQESRKRARRIVCTVQHAQTNSDFLHLLLTELSPVVDLFVLVHSNTTPQAQTIPADLHHKIYWVSAGSNETVPWRKLKKKIQDLRNDDMLLFVSDDQIPNIKALLYFKLYNGWPEPVTFRLRWSVYGFFWLHPEKTVLGGNASTAGLFTNMRDNNVSQLAEHAAFIVGDLNHFGGWQCSWCKQSAWEIIENLQQVKPTGWSIDDRKIDTNYVEELIANGLWWDGKTQLIRARASRDVYFAPISATNDTSKYDYLLRNMYMKFDY